MTTGKVKGPGKENPARRQSILVLGVGNILLSDEGVGVRVIEAMKDMTLPDNVELCDGGTASLALLNSLGNREKTIIIDAVRGGNKPGTLYRFTPGEVKAQSHMFASLHEIGLLETLTLAELLGDAPQNVTIFGVEPKEMDWGLQLSPEVEGVVPKLVELVFAELEN